MCNKMLLEPEDVECCDTEHCRVRAGGKYRLHHDSAAAHALHVYCIQIDLQFFQ